MCQIKSELLHISDLKDQPFCIALGSGASASVGLPTWHRLLQNICHSYFYTWSMKLPKNPSLLFHPPKDVSITLTNSYDMKFMFNLPDNFLENTEIWENGRKFSEEETQNLAYEFRESFNKVWQLQDDFIKLILSGDPTITAQMIKTKIRKKDWDYLLRKSIYGAYDGIPYVLEISELYEELITLISAKRIRTIINYNYDDTFYHALKERGVKFKNIYSNSQKICQNNIYYPHGYIPMKGGVVTDVVLCENDYQTQSFHQDLWENNIQIANLISHSCIFIGLSLNDSNIRRILNLCCSAARYKHYAFLPSSGDDEASIMYDSLVDSDLYRLGIRVIRYPSTNNFEKLPDLLNYINRMQSK